MRLIYLANNWVGSEVLRWLKEQFDVVAALVVHPPAHGRFVPEMIRDSGLPPNRIFDGSQLHQPAVLEAIRKLEPDMGVCVLFDHLLKPEFLRLMPKGTVNLLPAFLPCNRGQYPNVWSIVEGTPSGATIHYVDEGTETGDVIAQREVPVEPVDTGETLYRKLELACVKLFQETWPLIQAGTAPRLPQATSGGTSHRSSDLEKIDEIKLDQTCTARELINILRARTFPPMRGAYFVENGTRVYLRLNLEYGE